ncbi:MAG: aminoglycoside phosphotransferase family protein [Flavobacteriaceae bacterium]|nr:aminoglycoside phosphotransferase family protein [Flavobacteriaceae bacterium]
MKIDQLKYIFNLFNHNASFKLCEEISSGHINDTYLIKTKTKPFYILQRINHEVFKDVPGLVSNKVKISNHLRKKLDFLTEKELQNRVLSFVITKNNTPFYLDSNGNYWNMMIYIGNSKTYETVNNKEIAYEGGKLFGEFLNLTSDFDANQLIDVIPKFHDISHRYSQFEDALKLASSSRLQKANEYIKFVESQKNEMLKLQRLKESGEIKLRVTHNDTKISNALFSKNNKGLCVIDTDTVMPGIVHYDFGDAIRTICNTAAEDEKNLDLVNFNLSYYEAYKKGFLEKAGDSLSPIELKYLPLGVKTMIFIMAIRFLTDFLNNDRYYKIKYIHHNLNRAKNQFKLLKSFSIEMDNLKVGSKNSFL